MRLDLLLLGVCLSSSLLAFQSLLNAYHPGEQFRTSSTCAACVACLVVRSLVNVLTKKSQRLETPFDSSVTQKPWLMVSLD